MTKKSFLSFASVFTLAVSPFPFCARGEDYYVGGCAHGKADFTTISKAVTAVPSGSVINICPGVYPEQVTIEKAVTLHGVTDENGGAVVVTAPAAGMKLNIDSYIPFICGDSCRLRGAAQISAVNVDGVVNISDIVVDGAGAVLPPFVFPLITGLNFDSTTVNVDHVEIRNEYLDAVQPNNPEGYGMIVADTHDKKTVVSIVRSHLYLFSNTGIESSGKLVAAENFIDLRTITGFNGVFGIFQVGRSATINDNVVNGTGAPGLSPATEYFLGIGVQDLQEESAIKRNAISNTSYAIYASEQSGLHSKRLRISENRLVDNKFAIQTQAAAASDFVIEGNSITGYGGQSGVSTGIYISTCGGPLPTLADNVFSGTTIAFANVPAGTAESTRSHYHNVQQLDQTCP